MSYNNSDVVQCLRQYDMFASSLKLIRSAEEKNMIIKQLTKLENKILALTNELYEEEYYALADKECALLEDEKNRITMLIDLINQRLSFIEKRCNNHYQLTGDSIDVPYVLGVDTLDSLEDRVKIIDKYSKNIKLLEELESDIKSLTNKISLASEKITINESLNIELENVFKKVLSNAFTELNLYELLEDKTNLESMYSDVKDLLDLAKANLESARNTNLSMLASCEEACKDIYDDYIKYKDKVNTIKLMEIFNIEVNNYDELLDKRKQINGILEDIKNRDLLGMIMDTVGKQYNTILMEQQDINTFNDLALEKEKKIETVSQIEKENNSEEFQTVLKVLIENERKKQEKILNEQRKRDEEERKQRLEIERKKQEEILKRQRIIEEARKKEIEKRTKKMLQDQQNSVLQSRKPNEKVSFGTIKNDISNENNSDSYIDKQNDVVKDDENSRENNHQEMSTISKSRYDIEKELFEEFKSNQLDDVKVTDDIFSEIDEKINDNKLPSMSIDEYMKNFDEKSVSHTQSLFEQDDFPSIPI